MAQMAPSQDTIVSSQSILMVNRQFSSMMKSALQQTTKSKLKTQASIYDFGKRPRIQWEGNF